MMNTRRNQIYSLNAEIVKATAFMNPSIAVAGLVGNRNEIPSRIVSDKKVVPNFQKEEAVNSVLNEIKLTIEFLVELSRIDYDDLVFFDEKGNLESEIAVDFIFEGKYSEFEYHEAKLFTKKIQKLADLKEPPKILGIKPGSIILTVSLAVAALGALYIYKKKTGSISPTLRNVEPHQVDPQKKHENLQNAKTNIKILICDDILRILTILKEVILPNSRFFNTIINALSRFNHAGQEFRSRLIKWSEWNIERNNILESVLGITDSITAEDVDYNLLKKHFPDKE